MPIFVLVPLYLALVAAPLVLATLQNTPTRSIWNELATGAGLAGLAIMMVEFALSGRFRTVSRRIGMDVTMRMHQLLARCATVLILLHPFLYRGHQQLGRGQTAPGSGALNYDLSGLWPGIGAWLLLGALMVMALGRDDLGYRYQHWRLMHGLTALAMAGLGLLHALRAGRYSSDPALTLFWQALFAVALASLLWVYVIKPLLKAARPWKVAAVEKLGDRTWELRLSPVNHAGLRYSPGEFAWISVGHSPFSLNENPFSIASCPADGPDLRFVIKELGDFTSTLGDVEPGTRAYVDAPFGSLTLARHGNAPGLAFIAGGVGIAPMLSHLRALEAAGDPRPRTLIYANRHAGQIACRQELDRMATTGPLDICHVISEPEPGWEGETGFVTPELLARLFDTAGHRDWVHVLCGPPPMLETVEKALLTNGVPARKIILEQFSYD